MKQFDNVNAKRGAPMGRQPIFDNDDATVTVFKVNMVDGDYDDGGAYWGGGQGTDPPFCARGDGFLAFTRAKNIDEARAHFQDENCGINIQIDPNDDINRMVDGYLECAKWADAPEDTNPRFSNRAKAEALADCQAFVAKCGSLFLQALDIYTPEQFGNDFWMTRCGHGCGFWDRCELGELGDQLTKVCEDFRNISLYAERGWLNFDI